MIRASLAFPSTAGAVKCTFSLPSSCVIELFRAPGITLMFNTVITAQ